MLELRFNLIYAEKCVIALGFFDSVHRGHRHLIEKAKERIDNIVREAKVGEIFEGKVTRVENYGAFVNLFGDTDGLCHVSRLGWKYIDDANNVVKVGDTLKVVVIGLEEGKIKLSHREFEEKPEAYVEDAPRAPKGNSFHGTPRHNGPRRDGGRGNRH